jgi:hypothetical protein
MAKLNRERAVKEKRALKQEKREARKQAAADARNGTAPEVQASDTPVDENVSDENDGRATLP